MNQNDLNAGYKLLETASLVDFKVGEPIIQSSADGEYISLQVDLTLGSDDDDEELSNAVEWAAFGFMFA